MARLEFDFVGQIVGAGKSGSYGAVEKSEDRPFQNVRNDYSAG